MAFAFEWDPAKPSANLARHGISCEEAGTVFADPRSSVVADPDHSLGEERLVIFGVSDRGRVLAVMFTERGPRVRVISAREAIRPERDASEAGTL